MSETYKQIRRITHRHDKTVLRGAGKEEMWTSIDDEDFAAD